MERRKRVIARRVKNYGAYEKEIVHVPRRYIKELIHQGLHLKAITKALAHSRTMEDVIVWDYS